MTRNVLVEYAHSSSVSTTPDSNHYESPFAQDSLGDTVIHLDKVSHIDRLEPLRVAVRAGLARRYRHPSRQGEPHRPSRTLFSSITPPTCAHCFCHNHTAPHVHFAYDLVSLASVLMLSMVDTVIGSICRCLLVSCMNRP